MGFIVREFDRFFWTLFASVVLFGLVAWLVGCTLPPQWPECDRSPGAYEQASPGLGRTCSHPTEPPGVTGPGTSP